MIKTKLKLWNEEGDWAAGTNSSNDYIVLWKSDTIEEVEALVKELMGIRYKEDIKIFVDKHIIGWNNLKGVGDDWFGTLEMPGVDVEVKHEDAIHGNGDGYGNFYYIWKI